MYKNRWVKFTTNSSKELRDNFDDENGARCTSSVVFKNNNSWFRKERRLLFV